MRITKNQYEEYENLKKWAKRERVFMSAREIRELENDIDFPIKNCVGMFALLGCYPQYSCCGFDYEGQPFHKSHQHGKPYVILRTTPRTLEILISFTKMRSGWAASPGANRDWVNLDFKTDANPYWRKEDCIHFSEECVGGIVWLEQTLWQLRDVMADVIEVEDTNSKARKQAEYWQYPPKKPWIVYKSKIEASMQTHGGS